MSALGVYNPDFISSELENRISGAGVGIEDYVCNIVSKLRSRGEPELAKELIAEIDEFHKISVESREKIREEHRIAAEKRIEEDKQRRREAAVRLR